MCAVWSGSTASLDVVPGDREKDPCATDSRVLDYAEMDIIDASPVAKGSNFPTRRKIKWCQTLMRTDLAFSILKKKKKSEVLIIMSSSCPQGG